MATTNNIDPVSVRSSRLSSLLINRNFALLFAGQAISILGDEIFGMTLIVWVTIQIVAGQAWAPLAISGIIIAGTVPIFLIGPLAGVFADRWNQRRTMLWMDVCRAGVIASLLILPLASTMAPLTKLLVIYGAMFLESACAQFFNPSRLSLLNNLVPEEKRAQATGTEQASQAIAAILGPPIAAPLLLSAGAQWAILLDVLTFVLSFLAIYAIKVPPVVEVPDTTGRSLQGVRAEFKQGLHFALGNRTLRTLVVALFLVTLGIGSFAPLSVFFVTQNLAISATYTGILLSFFGGGAVLGAILFGMFAQRIGIKRLFTTSIILAGATYVLLSRLDNFLFALPVALLLGVMQAALNVATFPIVFSETPKKLVGRVASVLNPIATLGSLISVSSAGYVAGVVLAQLHVQALGLTFKPVDTVLTISGFIVMVGGIFAAFALREKKQVEQQAAFIDEGGV